MQNLHLGIYVHQIFPIQITVTSCSSSSAWNLQLSTRKVSHLSRDISRKSIITTRYGEIKSYGSPTRNLKKTSTVGNINQKCNYLWTSHLPQIYKSSRGLDNPHAFENNEALAIRLEVLVCSNSLNLKFTLKTNVPVVNHWFKEKLGSDCCKPWCGVLFIYTVIHV